ncbi:hypothetical protein DM01DRAFT_330221 [Hesseltinella vesiculosa]|uniref:Uncharacterized protein n=1 Tax=Hesseltinella vesiculosa TaxID=101127 RepID=A0A1X2G472_9FUNG|nr:hypothetical protein DM01DRAFT_330221 [Hesseltinella vesiculosa]
MSQPNVHVLQSITLTRNLGSPRLHLPKTSPLSTDHLQAPTDTTALSQPHTPVPTAAVAPPPSPAARTTELVHSPQVANSSPPHVETLEPMTIPTDMADKPSTQEMLPINSAQVQQTPSAQVPRASRFNARIHARKQAAVNPKLTDTKPVFYMYSASNGQWENSPFF